MAPKGRRQGAKLLPYKSHASFLALLKTPALRSWRIVNGHNNTLAPFKVK